MAYLITEEYITASCPSISTNNNGITIGAALQMVTLRYMKKLLSTDLHQLYADYVDGVRTQPLTSYQAELFDLVKYYMALQVERHMLTNLVEITSKGATAEATAATLEIVTFKRQELAASILTFETEIQDYLDSHAPEFPEYKPKCEATSGQLKRNRANNPFGISLEPDRPRIFR